MVGHGGSSAGSYLADPTSPIPSHCASIVVTSTVRVKMYVTGCTSAHTCICQCSSNEVHTKCEKVGKWMLCESLCNAKFMASYKNKLPSRWPIACDIGLSCKTYSWIT